MCWPAGPLRSRPAVFAIVYKPDPKAKPEEYGVIYVGHSDDLSQERFPFDHPAAPCWLKRVDGKRFDLYIAHLRGAGG